MAKLFRTRELLTKYPWLDAVRMKFLAWVCNHGTTFFDVSYRILKIFAPGCRELLETKDRNPVIFAIYHGRMVGALGLIPRKKLTILISQSRDGEMIARGAEGLGFSVARGSSTLGAVKGALEMVDAAKRKQDLAYMVDGPRGPRFEVKVGIIRLAEMTGLPIVPFVCCGRTAFWMKSWDRFLAPWWATPLLYLYGEPLNVDPDLSEERREELRLELESRMNSLRECGDRIWPHTGI